MRAPSHQAASGHQPGSGLRNPRAWLVSALVLAVVASILLAFAPLAREDTGDLVLDPSGGVVAERDRITFAADDGAWVYLVLLLPILIAAVPIVRRQTPVVAAVAGAVLGGFAILTGFLGFGLYYVPSALLMLIGAWMAELEGRPALIEIGGDQDRYRLGRSQMTGPAGAGGYALGGRRLGQGAPVRDARRAAMREPPPPVREEAPAQAAPPAPAQEAPPPASVREAPKDPSPEDPPAPGEAPWEPSSEEPRSPWGDEPPARWRRRTG